MFLCSDSWHRCTRGHCAQEARPCSAFPCPQCQCFRISWTLEKAVCRPSGAGSRCSRCIYLSKNAEYCGVVYSLMVLYTCVQVDGMRCMGGISDGNGSESGSHNPPHSVPLLVFGVDFACRGDHLPPTHSPRDFLFVVTTRFPRAPRHRVIDEWVTKSISRQVLLKLLKPLSRVSNRASPRKALPGGDNFPSTNWQKAKVARKH